VDETWLLPPPQSAYGSVAVEAFRASGLNYPHVTVVSDSPEVRNSLLPTGRYLTICAAAAVERRGRSPEFKILPVELPIDCLPNGIVTLKNRSLGPVVQLFIECARQVARPLAAKRK